MRLSIQLLITLFLLISCTQKEKHSSHKTISQKNIILQEKIDSILTRMTLEEKIGQMVQYNGFWDATGPQLEDKNQKEKFEDIKAGRVGSMLNVSYYEETYLLQKMAVENSRLGIPLLFALDVIHGFETIFPVPLAEAASFDLKNIEQNSRIAAIETSAAGIHWTFAPMVDICRDPRWGRVMEGAGEDPYYGSLVATARIQGFQSNDLSAANSIAACAKHFAAYGAPEGGRDYNTVDMSEWKLHNYYLPPYKACVDAEVATFMNSFNIILGQPATGNQHLVNDILRDEWGFNGILVSDWNSIAEMINHGFAKDKENATLKAIQATCDIDMEANAYNTYLKKLVDEKKISISYIDDAVSRVLTIKYKLGLFDDPYKYCSKEREEKFLKNPEHIIAAREAAKKSIVLLKNEKNILPLDKNIKTIAVIGPLAKDKDTPLGNWRAKGGHNNAVSLYEGVENTVSNNTKILYAEGCKLNMSSSQGFDANVITNETDKSGFAEAVRIAQLADVVIVAVGETGLMSGESRSYSSIDLPGVQEDLLKELKKTGKEIIVVLFNGRPLCIPWVAENIPVIIEGWLLGVESGNALGDVIFGDYNPAGKLPVSFPINEGQIPVYYNHFNTGRPEIPNQKLFKSTYIDIPNEPLYPFGFGLSYTTFKYSDIELSAETLKRGSTITASVTVSNTGKYDGEEVVQLYIQDLYASAVRPVKELKGFKKIMIKKGESKEISFEINEDMLSFYNAQLKYGSELGDFKVYIGTSSTDVKEASFVLEE